MQIGTDIPIPCLSPWPVRTPALRLPAKAWDCHAHVVGAAPWVSPRNYDPPIADIGAYIGMLDEVGLKYGVLVQVSVHGTNNDLLLEGLRLHPDRLRGVAAIAPDIRESKLAEMHEAGVRGVRLLTLTRGGVAPEAAMALAERIAPYGWHIEFGVPGHMLAELKPIIDALPVPVVLAHFGDCDMAMGIHGPQFAALRAILDQRDRYVKLSGAYRLCAEPWRDTIPVASTLIEDHRQSLLWGSDWPHVAISDPSLMPRTEALIELIGQWTSSDAALHAIFVENPARLYGLPREAGFDPNEIKGEADAHA
ncbi:putative TIM-barrel fold metal-dependent hydrolase [Sphingomonas vulcanisoli]|uniref:TIM-barrel fold metal-dependent hydrolase n=1 Tax=Sphingomonas vulcanisoli TaxID=1658060 RepID=A0ABX0TWI3_9SPHN|nr:amidohydrolase family protein [Sphingomonas vulcanisoli]NIJ08745.1 putative TIM-barrel fold metal-dependent hydrolase [Sphingomonas vulcanisoli]